MSHTLVGYSTQELDELFLALGAVSRFYREQGLWSASAQAKANASLINQHLIRRQADHRQFVARQLSLAPPGAYEPPA